MEFEFCLVTTPSSHHTTLIELLGALSSLSYRASFRRRQDLNPHLPFIRSYNLTNLYTAYRLVFASGCKFLSPGFFPTYDLVLDFTFSFWMGDTLPWGLLNSDLTVPESRCLFSTLTNSKD